MAGPMSQTQAMDFRKKWRTPPASKLKSPALMDPEKGLERVGRYGNKLIKRYICKKIWCKKVGSGGSACKKIGWSNAEKYYPYQFRRDSTTGIRKKMLVFTLAASRLNKFQSLPFSLELSRIILAAHWSRIKLQIMVISWRVDSRLFESVKKMIFFNCVGNGKVFVIK